MPKERYLVKNFTHKTELLIAQANDIIEEYTAQGFSLTLRQLYYQFVSRDIIPNNMRAYKRLGEHVNNGRMAGLIDWDGIIDRTRNLAALDHWGRPSEVLESAWQRYLEDKWAGQKHRVEVWIEKDALVGLIDGVCSRLQVPYFSCRGYTSQSEMWAASKRFRTYHEAGQIPIIIHLGDHDPSGMHMTQDIANRLGLFMYVDTLFPVQRIALNMDQIELYKPPPNPAKLTDNRAKAYVAEFGSSSWELDALEPQVVADLISDAVMGLRDDEAWNAACVAEATNRAKLEKHYNIRRRMENDGRQY